MGTTKIGRRRRRGTLHAAAPVRHAAPLDWVLLLGRLWALMLLKGVGWCGAGVGGTLVLSCACWLASVSPLGKCQSARTVRQCRSACCARTIAWLGCGDPLHGPLGLDSLGHLKKASDIGTGCDYRGKRGGEGAEGGSSVSAFHAPPGMPSHTHRGIQKTVHAPARSTLYSLEAAMLAA